MSTDPPAPFFGQFAAIRALDLPRTRVGDIYEGANAAVYDRLLGADEYDVPAYLQLAAEHPGRILELACGSGRIAFPLARAGHEVVGVDLAPDMLARLRHRLSRDEELAARITVVEGDMTAPAVEGPFSLAIIAATSICLLHDRADRRRAFASVRDLLAPDGRFALDHVATSPAVLRAQDAEIVTAGGPAGPRTVFTVLGRLWDPQADVQHVNFYTEVVDAEGTTDRILGSTTKAVVDNAELREDLEASGLTVETETVLQSVRQAGEVEEIRLLVCRRS